MSYKSAKLRLVKLVPALLAMSLVFLATFPLGAGAAQPVTGLTYDGDHDVIVFPTCDLAVRYNSKTFVPVKAKLQDTSSSAFLKISPDKAVKIWEDYDSAKMTAAPEQILIEVYDVGKIGSFGSSRFSKEFMAANRVREVQFTNERIAKETGLSASAFTGITAVKPFEIAPKSGEAPFYLYVIQTPEHLTIYARKMRAASRSFDLDPAVIVTQLQVRGTKDCVSNVKLEEPKVVAQ
ncbi:MAG: hypothetical protein Q8T09_01475 [Candidatus Melainabacteria bacterium]|nr:hypothetical protein [Candidatus Melainabacteria bacterium]